MASRTRTRPRSNGGEAKTLRNLEVRLLGIGRDLGEVLARARPAGSSAARRRLAFRAVGATPPARARLRFAPLPQEADRLIVTNWNPTPGVVVLGEVELELAPGQSAALWVNRAAPLPHTESLDEEPSRREAAFAFSDAAGPLL